jgi:thymidylate synthase
LTEFIKEDMNDKVGSDSPGVTTAPTTKWYIEFGESAEEQYLAMLQAIKHVGVFKGDRTGTGTQDLFGYQLRMDLSKGFPLLTTKKMFTRGIFEELLWMMSGDTNNKTLQDKKVKIWNEWSPEDGDLGPIYGKQFRRQSHYKWIRPVVFDPDPDPEFMLTAEPGAGRLRHEEEHTRLVKNGGIYGEYDRDDPFAPLLKDVWRNMISRCYNPNDAQYGRYGGDGVHVCARWRVFANFQKDAKRLERWVCKIDRPSQYSLDKDTRTGGNRYGPETCLWANREEQSQNTTQTRPFVAVSPEGVGVLFASKSEARDRHGLDPRGVVKCLKGERKAHHGWTHFQWVERPDEVLRFRHIDQLQEVVSGIRHNPNSRRHIISLWSPGEIGEMALPPCHGLVIQFSVSEGQLDCQMYQRSADVFLGVPFNIASYALFTHIIAGLTGLRPGILVHTFGSVHIYNNHREQVELQLSRKPYPLPTLNIKTFERRRSDAKGGLAMGMAPVTQWSIDNFLQQCQGASDFELINYQHHPKIKAEVSV